MNKLIFKYTEEYEDNITLIANNHKDLEEHLKSLNKWYFVEVLDDYVRYRTYKDSPIEIVYLHWGKEI